MYKIRIKVFFLLGHIIGAWFDMRRYAQLRGILEDSLGAGELPPDLPSDEKLIAAGAAGLAGGSGGPDAEAHAALKGIQTQTHELYTYRSYRCLLSGTCMLRHPCCYLLAVHSSL